jgi:hypothetical protein
MGIGTSCGQSDLGASVVTSALANLYPWNEFLPFWSIYNLARSLKYPNAPREKDLNFPSN